MNNYLLWNLHVTTQRRAAIRQDPARILLICVCQSCSQINSGAALQGFSLFAVPGKRQMCSRPFQVYPTKLDNTARHIKYRLAIFLWLQRYIDTSVTTVYSHNLHLEKLEITAGCMKENTSRTSSNNGVFRKMGELNTAHHILRVATCHKILRRRVWRS